VIENARRDEVLSRVIYSDGTHRLKVGGNRRFDIDQVVIEEHDAIAGDSQELGHVIEDLPVWFHPPDLERQEPDIERAKNFPAALVIGPVQRVRVAQTSDLHPALSVANERIGSVERSTHPRAKRLQVLGWCDCKRPVINDAGGELVGAAVPTLESSDPSTAQPPAPQVLIVVDSSQCLHRLDATEIEQHTTQVEQHDLDL
jgi:hypothetical protein